MAAAEVDSSLIVSTNTFSPAPFMRKANKVFNARANSPGMPLGVVAFDTGNVSIATTNADDVGDEFYLFVFPANCKLLSLVYTSTDRDTNATPTLSETIQVQDSAGTETALTGASTIGQSGSGQTELASGKQFTDVSNQKIGIKVGTAAATPAAGTVRLRGTVVIGEDNYGIIKF